MIRILPFILMAAAVAGQPAFSGRTLVLDDFETGVSAAWRGRIRWSRSHVSHGQASAELVFDRRAAAVTYTPAHSDWRGYDRLLFDVYSERNSVSTATLLIYDGNSREDKRRDYYEAENKILLQGGWNHVEFKLSALRTASYERDLSRDRIRRVVFQVDRGAAFPWTLSLDNVRLVAGPEPKDTATREQPQDAVTVIDGRFFTVRQVARPEEVPEAAAVAALRTKAEREAALLRNAVEAARIQGIETIYDERHLITAELGLRIRPRLAWFNNDASKRAMFAYVARTCRESRRRLEDKIQGTDRQPMTDDTAFGGPLIEPFPPLKGTPSGGWFFRTPGGDPMMILSLHSPSAVLQRFFATPRQHIESYAVGGGSRWTIEDSPVYAAFQADPDTHRVGWDGWCGHLVRDLDSMGVSKMENTVICLESPRIRKALEEYIRINIPKFNANPELLYNIMAYELMYICYCDRSQRRFREWLLHKHGGIDRANERWATSYRSFDEVVAPPVHNARPLPGTNRGLWYDWARFNQDRFTEHLLWVRSTIRKIDPSTPLAAGGSSSMLSGHTGTSGIDEERIVNEVDDVILHEGGGSTMGMDLQLALSEKPKPVADPEMSLGSIRYLMPHFLHGKSVAQLWHWPAQPGNEFHSNNYSSLAHGWMYPLEDIGELLRAAVDVRKLSKEIAAFVDEPAQVAILYSRTSTLQLPPEMLTWDTTPYLAELRKTYEAAQPLDSRVTFVSERKIREGWLDRYKLLLIPGVRNIPAGVVEKIWDFAARGGHVLITPESLIGDEYNRPAPYLARVGIRVLKTYAPTPGASDAMVQGYDQSFSHQVVFGYGPPTVLQPHPGRPRLPGLSSRGIRQEVRIERTAERLFEYADGSAAIVRVSLGQGAVYYSAASLEKAGYSKFLDSVFEAAGVSRPVRVLPIDTTPTDAVEARFAQSGGRRLLYVVNFGTTTAQLRIVAPEMPFSGLRELREGKSSGGNTISVSAGATNIYEIF